MARSRSRWPPPRRSSDPRPTPSATPARPTGAAGVYKWGPQAWRDEYESGIGSRYVWSDRAQVENRFGMLVLKGRTDGGATNAKLLDHTYRYGRWETRIHLRQWADQTQPFRMLVELVPTNAPYDCGAHNIVLADYTMGDNLVHFAIRNGGRSYTYAVQPNLGTQDWNTFAVEVARNHIAWFVNDKVVMNERDPGALSGLTYTLRYRWYGPNGAVRPPWMQMDWSRYYTMHLPSQLPLDAPSAEVSSYAASSC